MSGSHRDVGGTPEMPRVEGGVDAWLCDRRNDFTRKQRVNWTSTSPSNAIFDVL